MDGATILCALNEALGGAIATDTEIERTRQLLELRANAPLRKPREQHDVDGLGLFDAHRSPTLF